MTDAQKRELEDAAGVSGTSLSQWAIDRLLQSARRELAGQRRIVLSAEAYDAFVRALDDPGAGTSPSSMTRKTRWE